VFDEAKKMVYKQYPVEENGSGSPETLGVRKAFESFLCPLRIAEIKVDLKRYPYIKNEICPIINYDLTRLGKRSLEYHGVIDSLDKEKLKQTLVRHFNLNEKNFEDFYKDFKTIGWADEGLNSYTQFRLYNIRDDFGKFVFELNFEVYYLIRGKLIERFKDVPDYNVLFNLEPDPILPFSEVTKKDPTTGVFSDITLQYLQEKVCNIQLIPTVPKDVKRVFNHAKKLFIFGYFYYGFFTISEHYAYLALESAIRNRYNQFLGKKARIINPKGKTIESSSSWWVIYCLCKSKGWKPSKIKVNGQKFPNNNRLLLDWLVEKRIITKWEKKQYDVGINLRNILSHLEFAPIHTPNSFVLKDVADRINKLYYIHNA